MCREPAPPPRGRVARAAPAARQRFRQTAAPAFVLLCLLCAALGLRAQNAIPAARNWHISDFQSTIAIDRGGAAHVLDRISLVFVGSWHGIYRTIPVMYPGPAASNYKLLLNIESVEDDDLAPLKYEKSFDGDDLKLKIYLPGAVDTTRVVRINYSVKNAVRFFEDHSEFYWNVTGNEWPVPIDHASAVVTFPANTAGALRAQAFTGAFGATVHDATSEVRGTQATFETTSPLLMRSGLTVDVYVPEGLLEQSSVFTRAGWFLSGNPSLALPLWALLVMFLLWRWKGRDPTPSHSVAPLYEPPANITPAEAGALIADKVEDRDVTSIIFDLAVRGYIRMEETEAQGIFSKHKDYDFHLLKPTPQWLDLAPYERVMLEHIFGGGEKTRMSDLRNRFYIAVPMLKMDIMNSLKKKGMYSVSPESGYAWTVVGAVLSALPLLLGFTGRVEWDVTIVTVVSILVSALIVFLFGRKMTAKTRLGQDTYTEILGFQEFMRRVDEDRLKRMPPNTFEKFLPYAMALGMEHNWAKAFANIAQQPPSWYQSTGGGVFNSYGFVNDLGHMSTQATQVFTSAPRSSSSGSGFSGSGFSRGGGFSGGGFGGGGGGAF